MPLEPSDHDANELHAELLRRVRSLLAGEIQFIEGVRRIQDLRFQVTRNDYDPDFFVFVAVDSRSRDIPSVAARPQCAQSWLAATDKKARGIERRYAAGVKAACNKLLQRFQPCPSAAAGRLELP